MVKKMGYPSKRYKISPMTYFSVLISIVPSKYDFFLPFLITLDLKIFIFHKKKCESPRVSTSLVLETRKLVFLGLTMLISAPLAPPYPSQRLAIFI